MNRTQRAIKKSMRELENGRSSFKNVYLQSSKEFGNISNSDMLKSLQKEIKNYRKTTRSCLNKNPQEVLEV